MNEIKLLSSPYNDNSELMSLKIITAYYLNSLKAWHDSVSKNSALKKE